MLRRYLGPINKKLHKLYSSLQKLQLMLNKKTALLSLALLGSAFTIVGCSSNETSTAPESAQVTTAPDAAATVEGSAGVEVQADPAAQIEPIQSAPATTQQ